MGDGARERHRCHFLSLRKSFERFMKIGGLSFWSRIVFSLTLYGNTKERAVGHGVSHEKFFALGTFAVLGINVPSRYYGRYGSSVSLRVYFKFNRRLALF